MQRCRTSWSPSTLKHLPGTSKAICVAFFNSQILFVPFQTWVRRNFSSLKPDPPIFSPYFVCFGKSWRLHGVVSRHRAWPRHQLGSLVGGWRIHLASTWGASIGESSWESKRCDLFLRPLFSRDNGSRYKFLYVRSCCFWWVAFRRFARVCMMRSCTFGSIHCIASLKSFVEKDWMNRLRYFLA